MPLGRSNEPMPKRLCFPRKKSSSGRTGGCDVARKSKRNGPDKKVRQILDQLGEYGALHAGAKIEAYRQKPRAPLPVWSSMTRSHPGFKYLTSRFFLHLLPGLPPL